MKIKEVSGALLGSISESIAQHGFRLDKRKNEFKRVVGDSLQIFDLVYIKEDDLVKIKPEIRIKIKPIEDIYRSISTRGDIYRTLGNDLFEILRYMDKREETGRGDQYYWMIKEDKDIEKLIKIIPEYFEETILSYFNENSTVARVDLLLNKYPREISVHNWLYPLRAILAIIAAKLNRNPQFYELVRIYEEELVEAEESYKKEFSKAKLILEKG